MANVARVLPLTMLAFVLLMLAGLPASAQQSSLSANLDPLNRSDASGTATVSVSGNQVTVNVQANGVSPTLPHAQHIHLGGQNVCPPATAASQSPPADLIDTVEGRPFYGAVQVSLTTTGAVGADSALAVERFPTADANGSYTYSRTFDLPAGVTQEQLNQGVIVVHGISKLFGDNAQYDGDPRSSLDPSLPLEATIPTLCGSLASAQVGAVPAQGVGAGAGGTANTRGPVALASALLLLASFGLVARAARLQR